MCDEPSTKNYPLFDPTSGPTRLNLPVLLVVCRLTLQSGIKKIFFRVVFSLLRDSNSMCYKRKSKRLISSYFVRLTFECTDETNSKKVEF